MASSSDPLRHAHLAFLLSISQLLASVSGVKPSCHSDERSALLQFKQSFLNDSSVSADPSSNPKMESWNNSDCCLWDGVECDEITGHVIGLDLSSSWLILHDSFNSSSSLFHLSHLQSLNLADNYFNYSQIPPKIASLSNLVYLNLSLSEFYGQVPMDISKLPNLVSLDLHEYDGENGFLYLVDFQRLVENLTKLETLDLANVNISSTLPHHIFLGLPSLTSLSLKGCKLIGTIPSSLGQLTKLTSLDLSINNFAGEVPTGLKNLTELVELDLSDNNFTMGGLSWLGKQTKLKSLILGNANLVGDIPSCLKNLTQLTKLGLGGNKLKSQIPSWLSNLTQLTILDLGDNELHGPIPESIFQLVSLEELRLGPNHLSGIVRFELFSGMKHLNTLEISSNGNLTLLTDDSINATLPKFKFLGLNGCNLRKFPNFLRYQNHLFFLTLYHNNIEGRIPSWIANVGKETLFLLELSFNSLSGLENPLTFSLFKNLVYLSLRVNKLQGPLPPPPLSIQSYDVSHNNLTGEISPWFCNLTSLIGIDLHNNSLNGNIPQCLLNSNDRLAVLDLANNHFDGNIPDTFGNRSKLIFIDLSHNRLEGGLPRSLGNCKMLQILQLNGNQIHDKFPAWLGSLPKLEVIILRYNRLFGALKTPHIVSQFPKLRILDLSHNEFTGTIPSRFFQTFMNMKAFDTIPSDQMSYMQNQLQSRPEGNPLFVSITYYMVLANKGMDLAYGKIPNVLAAVDFSSNKFQGEIPESITTLKMINVLNFSNNLLSGHIPSFLRNLTNLESLDLSGNNFSGEIPPQLTELTFLEYFNVSNNQLTGSIPQANQFGTFDNTSYQGNSGLCGTPLTKRCGNLEPSAQLHDGGSNLPIEVSWKSVAIGYGSGIMVGVVLGLVFYERHQNWVLHTFGRWQKRRPRISGRRTIR